MGRPGGPGPLDPIYDVATAYGAIATGNTPGVPLLTVTINQGASQPDPAVTAPIVFEVVFSEAVTGFATGDVTLSGTAGATTATVVNSGDDINFTVNVTGMTSGGTVTATIAAGVCTAIATGTPNRVSTSTDNEVTWLTPVLTDLNAWYDASVALSVHDTAGTVTQWDDLSGNARHLTVPLGETGPTTGSRTRNGLNVLDSNGTDIMGLSTFTAPGTFTVFVVCVQDTTPGGAQITTIVEFAGAQQFGLRLATTAPQMASTSDGTLITGSAYANGDWRQMTGEHKGPGQTMGLWQNGTAVGNATPTGAPGGSFAILNIAPGAFPQLDGALAEILVYSPTVSTPTRTATEAYLAAKWGPFP